MKKWLLVGGLASIALALLVYSHWGQFPAPPPAGVRIMVEGREYSNITSSQLEEWLGRKDFFLVNVHVPYEGEIEKTDAFIPYNAIDQNHAKLPDYLYTKVVVYSRSGEMSVIAAAALLKLGYTNVWTLDGGMSAWERAGYPLIRERK